MKKILVMFIVLVFASIAWAESPHDECPNKDKEPELKSQCPVTFMIEKCLHCHTSPDFKVKEINPHARYDYPLLQRFHFEFNKEGKPVRGYYVMTQVDSDYMQSVLNYCDRHDVNYLIVELFTPGGGLGEAYKIVGLMRTWESQGNVIETRVYGYAASAGFLIFASGTRGSRFVTPQAELMWHELQSFEYFTTSTPSSKEEEARVYRHLQNTANNWLAEVSHLTKEEIDDKVAYKELWITGVEAVEYGFADALLVGAK